MIVFRFHQHVVQILIKIYLERLSTFNVSVSNGDIKHPIGKSIFSSYTFPSNRYKCWHWRSKVSPYNILYVFWQHTGEIWTKSYCPKYSKFWAFWQKTDFLKTPFDKSLTPFCKTFVPLKQLFNGGLLFFWILFFSVPQIIVVRHTRVIRLKVSPNMADPTSMEHSVSSLK